MNSKIIVVINIMNSKIIVSTAQHTTDNYSTLSLQTTKVT
jgi:hypothetical protein